MANQFVNPNFGTDTMVFQGQKDQGALSKTKDFLAYGLTGAAASAGLGIYNTGVAIGNMFGSDIKQVDTEDLLNNLGMERTADYYDDNRGTLDVVGLIAGSFVPGVAGIRALRAGQAVASSSARLSTGFKKVLLPDNKVKSVREAIYARGMDAQAVIDQNKYRSIAAGFHQQALEAAAFEGAVLLTMNQQSSLNAEDLGYFDAIGANLGMAAFGLVFGAGIGGIFEGVANVGMLKAEKKLYDFSKGNSAIKILADSGEVGIAQGDLSLLVAKSYNEAKLTMESEGFGKLSSGEQADVLKKRKKSELELKIQLLKLAGGDPDKAINAETTVFLRDRLFDLIDSGTSSAQEVLSGVKGYRMMSESDALDNTLSSQVSFLFDSEAVAWVNGYVKSTGMDMKWVTGGKETAEEYIAGLKGAAAGAKFLNVSDMNNIRGFDRMEKYLEDPTAWENIFTWRHELGHTLLNEPARFWANKSAMGQRIMKQAKELSRQARPVHWDNYDLIIKKQNAGLDLTERESKHLVYMDKSEELFADSYGMLSDPLKFTTDKAMKEYPELYRVFVGNNAARTRFTRGKQTIDLRTGEFTGTAVTPTAADVSPAGIRIQGNSILYGKNQSTSLAGKFDATSIDYVAASAKYAVARTRKDVKAGMVVEFDDLPTLSAAVVQAIPVVVLRDGVDVTGLYPHGISDILAHSKIETVNKLLAISAKAQEADKIKQGITAKGEFSRQADPNNPSVTTQTVTPIPGWDKDLGRALSESEIARIADVEVDFVQRATALERLYDPMQGTSALPKGSFGKDTDSIFASLSTKFDPMTPRYAVIKADQRAVKDNNRIWGETETLARIKAQHAAVDSVVAAYFKDEATAFPNATHLETTNPADNISTVDNTSGVVTSANQEVFSGGAVLQKIGAVLAQAVKKVLKRTDDVLDPHIVKLSVDEAAVNENSVLDSILRQAPSGQEYEFFEGWDVFLKGLTDEGYALNDMAIQALEDSGLLAKLAVELNQQNFIWRGELRNGVAAMLKASDGADYDDLYEVAERLMGDVKNTLHEIKHAGVGKYWREMVRVNASEVAGPRNHLGAVTGSNAKLNTKALYPGPADTRLYPFHALVIVEQKGVLGMQEAGMVVAKDAADLQRKISDLERMYPKGAAGKAPLSVYTKDQVKDYKRAQAMYQSTELFRQAGVDGTLMRKGILWDVTPQPNPDIFNHQKAMVKESQVKVARGMVSAKYSEEVATLRMYGSYLNDYNSRFGADKSKRNVYTDMENMMLNKRPESDDNMWNRVNTATDEAISKAYYAVKGALQGTKVGDSEKMNKVLEDYGMKAIYDQATPLLLTNIDAPRARLGEVVSKANGILGTLMLRMDNAQAMVNVLSLPIMIQSEISALRRFATADRWQVLKDGTSIKVPGTDKTIQSTGPLMMQAVKDYFGPKGKDLRQEYRRRGLLNSTLEEIAAAEGYFAELAKVDNLGKATELLKRATDIISIPNDWSEQFTKFLSARVADLATETLGVSDNLKWSTINAFSSRVMGNYIQSQRPTLFQGWAGQAIGLFQTYQFNLIQSLFGNVAAKDRRAVSTMLGLQAGIFGAQSVPGFQMLNQYVGERSLENKDFYSATNGILGKDVGNWLMYGTASSATVPILGNGLDLYARGDLTPRTPILIPTSPSEVPIISAASKFFGSIFTMADRIGEGAPLSQSFLDALAHNGLNRPLQNLGQLATGYRTTAQGQTLETLEDFNILNAAARVLITKPLDEAVAVGSYYRTNAYKASRQAQLDGLGDAYRTALRAGQDTPEMYTSFMDKYAATGGRIENYSRWVGTQYRNATQSQIDRLRESNNSPQGRYLQTIMGGEEDQRVSDPMNWTVGQ